MVNGRLVLIQRFSITSWSLKALYTTSAKNVSVIRFSWGWLQQNMHSLNFWYWVWITWKTRLCIYLNEVENNVFTSKACLRCVFTILQEAHLYHLFDFITDAAAFQERVQLWVELDKLWVFKGTDTIIEVQFTMALHHLLSCMTVTTILLWRGEKESFIFLNLFFISEFSG